MGRLRGRGQCFAFAQGAAAQRMAGPSPGTAPLLACGVRAARPGTQKPSPRKAVPLDDEVDGLQLGRGCTSPVMRPLFAKEWLAVRA